MAATPPLTPTKNASPNPDRSSALVVQRTVSPNNLGVIRSNTVHGKPNQAAQQGANGTTAAGAAAADPPLLRYKTVNTKYKAQIAPDGSAISQALKRVPPRVKALGGPILDDFLAIAMQTDKSENKVEELEKELEEARKATDALNERLEEGRTNFDLLVTRFTNSVEQATTLRQQVDEERQDTSARQRESAKVEKALREQVATLRRQMDGERLMYSNYKKEAAVMKSTMADLEKELASFKTASTLSETEPKSRREWNLREDVKRLTSETGDLKDDLTRNMEARRQLESALEKLKNEREEREAQYQDLLRKYEATSRIMEKTQDRLASANEYLDVTDQLAADDALARVIAFNEEITQCSSLFVTKVEFLEDGEDDLPNPYEGETEEDERSMDMVHRFLSPRFTTLLVHHDHERRKVFLDLAIRACLVYFASVIVNGGCFGLREDLDSFLLQVWGIIQSQNVQATAGRWRALTHKSIRASPQFPVNRTLVPSMTKSITKILRLARCLHPEQTAEGFIDDLTALHASAVALEVDFKQKVLSTTYTVRVVNIDAPYLAVEMLDISVFMEGMKGETPTHAKSGVKTVLACVSLGLTAGAGGPGYGRTRKSLSGKSKSDIRLEPTVLLDAILQ